MDKSTLAILSIFAPIHIAIGQHATQNERNDLDQARHFSDQVVRVIPTHTDGSPAQGGFGLIVGKSGQTLYIATSWTIVLGSDPRSPINVIFRDKPKQLFEAERIEASKWDDLAVVGVRGATEVQLPHATTISSLQLPQNTRIWYVGSRQSWDMPDHGGTFRQLDVANMKVRVGGLHVPLDAAGGAAITKFGVLGMILKDDNGDTLVLPVDRIVEVFKAWDLPSDLLIPLSVGYGGKSTPAGALSPSRPYEYCGALDRLIQAAFNKFSDIRGKGYFSLYYDSNVELPGWHDCQISNLIRDTEIDACYFGSFKGEQEAYATVAEIANDIKTECLPGTWSASRRGKLVEFHTNHYAPVISILPVQSDKAGWEVKLTVDSPG